jgi:bifunctional non-homologous end joining protein LigD
MAAFPQPFRPMLLEELKRPFHKPGWVYEEKYDGYRMLAYKERDAVRLVSRNLKDFTRQFVEIAGAVGELRAPTLILDGEVAAFDESLVSHLGYLRGAPPGMILTPPVFIAFDCLYARGRDLMGEPLRRRRSTLERELRDAGGPVLVARRLADNGLEAWKEVVEHGWEGLIAKDPDSVYTPGVRTRSWIKVKHKVRIGWPGEGVEYSRV